MKRQLRPPTAIYALSEKEQQSNPPLAFSLLVAKTKALNSSSSNMTVFIENQIVGNIVALQFYDNDTYKNIVYSFKSLAACSVIATYQ